MLLFGTFSFENFTVCRHYWVAYSGQRYLTCVWQKSRCLRFADSVCKVYLVYISNFSFWQSQAARFSASRVACPVNIYPNWWYCSRSLSVYSLKYLKPDSCKGCLRLVSCYWSRSSLFRPRGYRCPMVQVSRNEDKKKKNSTMEASSGLHKPS